MRAFSLFSGIGGFDLALKKKGHQVVGACEIDKHARRVYTKHFPDVPVWDDATRIDPKELPDFEMLCAGFPCQAFSLAGKRLGFEDTRGKLFYEIARIAREKRPQYLFLENVKGLLYHDKGRTAATIFAALDELGYDAEWQVINGKYFLPQNRERIYIIGHLREKPSRKIFPIGETGKVNTGTPKETQEQGKRLRNQITGAIDANYSKGGGSRTMIACIMQGHNKQNGRKVNTDYTFALTTREEQIISDGHRIRSLTPLECERLQGFPDNWTSELKDTYRYKCLGNAVMVPVIEEILDNFGEKTP